MLSVGIDTVEIDRIEKSVSNERFAQHVYGMSELAEIRSHGSHARNFASAFAVKEAFSKSLGTGVRGFALREVQLVHDELGAPSLLLSGAAAAVAAERGLEFCVSVTHTDSIATAIVIANQKG